MRSERRSDEHHTVMLAGFPIVAYTLPELPTSVFLTIIYRAPRSADLGKNNASHVGQSQPPKLRRTMLEDVPEGCGPYPYLTAGTRQNLPNVAAGVAMKGLMIPVA
jgi:hypothetical protein